MPACRNLVHTGLTPYDRSALGYIQVLEEQTWYKWIPKSSSQLLNHSHNVHTQSSEMETRHPNHLRLCWVRAGLFDCLQTTDKMNQARLYALFVIYSCTFTFHILPLINSLNNFPVFPFTHSILIFIA